LGDFSARWATFEIFWAELINRIWYVFAAQQGRLIWLHWLWRISRHNIV